MSWMCCRRCPGCRPAWPARCRCGRSCAPRGPRRGTRPRRSARRPQFLPARQVPPSGQEAAVHGRQPSPAPRGPPAPSFTSFTSLSTLAPSFTSLSTPAPSFTNHSRLWCCQNILPCACAAAGGGRSVKRFLVSVYGLGFWSRFLISGPPRKVTTL